MNSREIIRRLEAAGWRHYRTTGSHWHFRHDSLAGKVTVPHPRKDIPIKTLKSIEKQAGLKLI
ncbi:MAG: type II toxin-antitoxin system HicA family toxin [Desulfobaccales bacterium]